MLNRSFMSHRLFALTILAPCSFALFTLPACSTAPKGSGQVDHGDVALAVYAPDHGAADSGAIACSAVEPTDAPGLKSAADVIPHLDGVWRRCSGSEPWQPAPHDGVEIDASGRVFLLHADASGALQRSTGFDNEYFIAPVQNGDDWTAYELRGDSGVYPKAVAFSSSGSTFRWVHGTAPGDDIYVRTSEPVGGALTGHRGARLGAAGCTLPEAGVHGAFHTQAELTAAIAGKWTVCGDSFFPGTNGFELTSDGQFFALVIDANGVATRSTAPDQFGTISYYTRPGWDGETEWYFELQSTAGLYLTPAAVAEAPVKLQLSNMGIGPYTYSALP